MVGGRDYDDAVDALGPEDRRESHEFLAGASRGLLHAHAIRGYPKGDRDISQASRAVAGTGFSAREDEQVAASAPQEGGSRRRSLVPWVPGEDDNGVGGCKRIVDDQPVAGHITGEEGEATTSQHRRDDQSRLGTSESTG